MDALFLHARNRPKSWLKQQERIPDRNEEKEFSNQKVVNHSVIALKCIVWGIVPPGGLSEVFKNKLEKHLYG